MAIARHSETSEKLLCNAAQNPEEQLLNNTRREETFILMNQHTRRRIPEDRNRNAHCRNLNFI
jgi:hypothetical protein